MSLHDWLENGWLKEHDPNPQDIGNLLNRADRNLQESAKLKDPDWKFNIAYAAIINLADAALMAEGYRTRSGAHHYYSIQSLALTLKLEKHIVEMLDSFRRTRHMATYEQVDIVSEIEAEQALKITLELRDKVVKWLKTSHNELMNE